MSTITALEVIKLPSRDGAPDASDRHVDLAHDTLVTGWPALVSRIREYRDHLRTQRRLEARATGGGLLAASELPEFAHWIAWLETRSTTFTLQSPASVAESDARGVWRAVMGLRNA